ncbi:Peptidase S8, subtilisin-related protein [Cordyceps fumosorosea ARSEF 2679]|uniref:Peptidase S8, subtilisin-related protein n=1 Tax=Cordyceps fumosorosea (strain ARSEF 2679) TaxID=1081104 RepID=A0A167XJF8_CORFA|nr:Peptidase S8, subtilisin-related protein [Cordyceps fumosorosea ARSEF 2679]OAA65044.1 Peptidase S8, subtilisin-related protein [Cordyceps fumosorosea ARSEF 2679]
MRVTTILAALPLALAGPILETSGEPAPLYLHEAERRSELAPLYLHELEKRDEPAPLILHEPEGDLVARGGSSRFIIKFKGDREFSAVEAALRDVDDENVAHTFNSDFLGFTAQLDRSTVEGFRMVPGVEYIEQDMAGTLSGFRTQSDAPWGLGRISHRQAGSSDYIYDESAGKGVCVYVTDSGIDDSHPEFEGRAKQIKSFVSGSSVDDNGHGTHCAGTIGSATYGVAKKATLLGVKVIDSNGDFWYSDLIAAYDFIQKDARSRSSSCPGGFVVSGSLGGNFSQSMNDAANAMVDAGFFMAIAAGNNNKNARDFSPASASKVCAVGGTQSDDRRYASSNWGPVVKINGPAVNVLSTVPGGETAFYTGTSMATPHIAGLAAYLAAKNGVKASPALCKTIVDMATKNAVTNQVSNTVTNIAYNGSGQ